MMHNKTINGYTIKRPLGEGGMAEVWYAENSIGKPAAIKFLKKKFCEDETVVERFRNEASVMVQLDHPYIRNVYDYVMIDNQPCIIMEYLEGQDLKTLVKKHGAINGETAEKYWNQIVSALNYTHEKGVIHRDIKPSNIFVTKEGDVKLLDFGIAKVRDAVSGTQTGQKLGTLVYMSPEQITDSKHVDSRTDIYSLAVTFVHLLSGRIPYDSDSSSDYAIMDQIVKQPLNMTGISKEWQAFLTPYLEKGPDNRPQLQEFAEMGTHENPSDSTIIDMPVTRPKEVTAQPDPKKDVRSRRAKISLWISGVLMALPILLTMIIPLQILDPYPKLTGRLTFITLFSTLLNYIILNIAFIQQSKYANTRWIIGICSVLLLLALLEVMLLGFGYDMLTGYAPLTMFVGIEGLLFVLLFGRTRWINATLSVLTIIGTAWLVISDFDLFKGIIFTIVLFVFFGSIIGFILFLVNKKEHFYPRERSSEVKKTAPFKWQWIPKTTKGRMAALGVILVLLGLILFKSRAKISDPKTEALAQTYTVNGVSFTMKYVEGGTFLMGQTPDQRVDEQDFNNLGFYTIDTSYHKETVGDFCIGETEVTQALWNAVMGADSYKNKMWKKDGCWGDNYPAYLLSWYDCQEFISKLNALTGKKFRLPWEAEWEYAARGGITSKGYSYSGSNNIDDVAWYAKNSEIEPHVVKTKSPNELGLYDMSGNIKEWCLNRDRDYRILLARLKSGPWGKSSRVLRGGSIFYDAGSCKVSSNDDDLPDNPSYGFRLVLVP